MTKYMWVKLWIKLLVHGCQSVSDQLTHVFTFYCYSDFKWLKFAQREKIVTNVLLTLNEVRQSNSNNLQELRGIREKVMSYSM